MKMSLRLLFIFLIPIFFSSCQRNTNTSNREDHKIIWKDHPKYTGSIDTSGIPSEYITSSIPNKAENTNSEITSDLEKNSFHTLLPRPDRHLMPTDLIENKEAKRERIKLKDIKEILKTAKQNEGRKKLQRAALWSFILSFIALYPYLGILCALASIILGGIGLSKILKDKENLRGKGYAIAGICISVFILLLYAAIIYFLLFYSGGYYI